MKPWLLLPALGGLPAVAMAGPGVDAGDLMAALLLLILGALAGIAWQRYRAGPPDCNPLSTAEDGLFDRHPAPQLLLDEQGRVCAVNQAFCRFSGLSPASLLQQAFSSLPMWQGIADATLLSRQLQESSCSALDLRLTGDAEHAPAGGYRCQLASCRLSTPSGPRQLIVLHDLSILDHSQQQLQLSEQRFRQLFEAIPDALILSRRTDGQMLDVNSGFSRLTGLAREQVIGQTSLQLGLWPDPVSRRQLLAELARSGVVDRLVLPFRGGEGQTLHCEFNTRPLQINGEDCLLSMVRDSTERELLHERLRQAAAVFESTAEAVMIIDLEQRVVAVNRAFCKITGYSEQEVLGHTPQQLGAIPQDPQFEADVMTMMRQEGYWQGEIWSRRRSGDSYPAWLTLSTVRDTQRAATHLVAVFADISSLKQAQARLDHQANHDPVTSLPNRVLFENNLHRAIEASQQEGHGGAVLFLDLDHFKHINDSLGHPVGDELLRAIANRLRHSLREQDTLARLGGDEFIVLLPSIPSTCEVERVAMRLMECFASPYHASCQEFFITASMGISLFPQNGSDVATLVKSADAAMYRAKARGRNRLEYYSDEMGAQATERVLLENDLRRAIALNQLYLVFQPKISLHTDELVGAEVLLRWQHPEYGELSPERFIPIAEDSGVIVSLGDWVLEETCRQLTSWLQDYQPFGPLAVNLAGAQIDRPELPQQITDLLARHQLAASCLELEITETFVMTHTSEILPRLNALRSLGVRLAIDDFGTGYSSLSHLKRLPVHALKIDKTFIDGLPDDPEDAAITRAIIALGRSMHLTVIAEGVETKAQELFLSLEGCQQIQGYIVSRPLRAASFAEHFLQPRQTLGAEQPPSL